jgi:hypothetical protein
LPALVGSLWPSGNAIGAGAMPPAGAAHADDAADELERRLDRAHQCLPQGAAHDAVQIDARAAAPIDLYWNVQVDVAAGVAQQRQDHVERDAELALERRVPFGAAEVELMEGQRVLHVVLTVRELGGRLDAGRPR